MERSNLLELTDVDEDMIYQVTNQEKDLTHLQLSGISEDVNTKDPNLCYWGPLFMNDIIRATTYNMFVFDSRKASEIGDELIKIVVCRASHHRYSLHAVSLRDDISCHRTYLLSDYDLCVCTRFDSHGKPNTKVSDAFEQWLSTQRWGAFRYVNCDSWPVGVYPIQFEKGFCSMIPWLMIRAHVNGNDPVKSVSNRDTVTKFILGLCIARDVAVIVGDFLHPSGTLYGYPDVPIYCVLVYVGLLV